MPDGANQRAAIRPIEWKALTIPCRRGPLTLPSPPSGARVFGLPRPACGERVGVRGRTHIQRGIEHQAAGFVVQEEAAGPQQVLTDDALYPRIMRSQVRQIHPERLDPGERLRAQPQLVDAGEADGAAAA